MHKEWSIFSSTLLVYHIGYVVEERDETRENTKAKRNINCKGTKNNNIKIEGMTQKGWKTMQKIGL